LLALKSLLEVGPGGATVKPHVHGVLPLGVSGSVCPVLGSKKLLLLLGPPAVRAFPFEEGLNVRHRGRGE